MDSPRLSICIATYNRADFIGATLDSIIPQLTNEVELVVADGASTDNTQEIILNRCGSLNNVRYLRLPQKGGIDQDYCKAIEFARGEYVWLFTDDDLLDQDAIRRVLNELKSKYSVIIVNARLFNSDLSELLASTMLDGNDDCTLDGSDMDRLFEMTIPYVSFIGCIVMERSVWLRHEKDKYFGTEFVHVAAIFQSPLPGKVRIMGRPAISIRYGNAQWTPRSSLIWLGKWPKLLLSFDSVSDEVRRNKTNLVSWTEMKKMIVYRALHSYSWKTFRKVMPMTSSPLWWKGCALVIALLPAGILNVVVAWYLRSFRFHTKEARMILLDLSKV